MQYRKASHVIGPLKFSFDVQNEYKVQQADAM